MELQLILMSQRLDLLKMELVRTPGVNGIRLMLYDVTVPGKSTSATCTSYPEIKFLLVFLSIRSFEVQQLTVGLY
jgi:hypothetical protein